MLGFGSKTSWKSIIASTYYALSFLGFMCGVRVGVAILVVAWSVPAFSLAMFEALFHGRKEQFYCIPVFIGVLGISVALVVADFDAKIKSATAVNAVAEINTISKPESESVNSSESTENEVFITSSGGKYHREDCRFIKDRKVISVSADEAASRGLHPCSVCLE